MHVIVKINGSEKVCTSITSLRRLVNEFPEQKEVIFTAILAKLPSILDNSLNTTYFLSVFEELRPVIVDYLNIDNLRKLINQPADASMLAENFPEKSTEILTIAAGKVTVWLRRYSLIHFESLVKTLPAFKAILSPIILDAEYLRWLVSESEGGELPSLLQIFSTPEELSNIQRVVEELLPVILKKPQGKIKFLVEKFPSLKSKVIEFLFTESQLKKMINSNYIIEELLDVFPEFSEMIERVAIEYYSAYVASGMSDLHTLCLLTEETRFPRLQAIIVDAAAGINLEKFTINNPKDAIRYITVFPGLRRKISALISTQLNSIMRFCSFPREDAVALAIAFPEHGELIADNIKSLDEALARKIAAAAFAALSGSSDGSGASYDSFSGHIFRP